jgi:hypothetical protein
MTVDSDVYNYPSAVGVQDRTFSPLDYANSSGAAVDVEVTVTSVRRMAMSSGLSGTGTFRAWVSIFNVTDSLLVASIQDFMPNQLSGLAASQSAQFVESTSFVLSVPAGKTYRLTPFGRLTTNVGSTGTHTLTTSAYSLRYAAVKR